REIFGNRRTPTLDVFLRGMAADEGGGGRRRNLSGEPPPTLPLPSRARLYLIGPPQRTATEGRIGNQASDASRSRVSPSASEGSSSGLGPTNFTSRASTLRRDRIFWVLASVQRSCFSIPLTRTCRPFLRNWEQSSARRRQTSTSTNVTDWAFCPSLF